MARTKPRVIMTYRSIGSGAGATEFNNGASAFGCGDVPLPNATYNAMVGRGVGVAHVPFLVGSVSVFHNVPGVGKVRERASGGCGVGWGGGRHREAAR